MSWVPCLLVWCHISLFVFFYPIIFHISVTSCSCSSSCTSSPWPCLVWELLPPEFPMDLLAGFYHICKSDSGQSNTGLASTHNLVFALLILFLTIPIVFISKLWKYEVLVRSPARGDTTNTTNLELHCLGISGAVLSSVLSLIPWGPSPSPHRQV